MTIRRIKMVNVYLRLTSMSVMTISTANIKRQNTTTLSTLQDVNITINVRDVDIKVVRVVVPDYPLAGRTHNVTHLLRRLKSGLINRRVKFLASSNMITVKTGRVAPMDVAPVLTIATRVDVSHILAYRRQHAQENARKTTNVNLHRARTLHDRTIRIENLCALLSVATRIAVARIIT